MWMPLHDFITYASDIIDPSNNCFSKDKRYDLSYLATYEIMESLSIFIRANFAYLRKGVGQSESQKEN